MSGHGLVTPGETMRDRAALAVQDPTLQRALRNLDRRLHTARAVEETHADWKDRAAAIRRETLADLDGEDKVARIHVAEALSYRGETLRRAQAAA